MKWAALVLVVLAASAAAWHFTRAPRAAVTARFHEAVVSQGDLTWTLHEAGTLFPRDPHLIKARFAGRLQWMAEDGTWVEAGDTVFVMNEEDELKRVAEERSRLLSARQEQRLARLRRTHATTAEAQKLAVVRRALEIEQLRHRILTTTPLGGEELVRLHRELLPIEAETARLRLRVDQAQDAFLIAQDAYFAALDRWQDHRAALLRIQARIDEQVTAGTGAAPEESAAERSEREVAVARLAEARAEFAALGGRTAGLAGTLAATRSERDRVKAPYDDLSAQLTAREERERELAIRIEIEKRGLTATQLRLDEEAQRLGLAEAERKLAAGTVTLAAGALSRAGYEALDTAVQSARATLDITRARLAIAERPPAPEILAEAAMKLERAATRAAAAQANHDRNLAVIDQEIALAEAKVARLRASITARSRNFAALVEGSLQFAERELGLLGPDEGDRRREVESEIAELRSQLEAARANPPNIEKAPVAGIAMVKKQGDRPRQAGDRVQDEDVLIELYPSANMEVQVKVNETNVGRLRPGLAARVVIPALKDLACVGNVHQVAGVGRDKAADSGGFADVVQFDVRVRLDRAEAAFRPGMTALVDLVVERRDGVRWLPRAAIRRDGDTFAVLVPGAKVPELRRLRGYFFADDAFVVEDGLATGDRVLIERVVEE